MFPLLKAGLPSHCSPYERTQNGLAWEGPQSSSDSKPCCGQGCHCLDQAAQGPFKLPLKVDISPGLVSDAQLWTVILQEARSSGVPAAELSSSGAFCSLQHLPNGRHHAELPGYLL